MKSVCFCAVALAATSLNGCGGSSGGGTQPPPATITLTSIAPYQASFYSANPPWVPAGIQSFQLLANGTNFTSTSVLQWNGAALPTQFGTSSNLAATISSTLVTKPGTANITVYDSATGAKSGSLSFGIAASAAATAGVVQIVTVTPDGMPANGNSLVASSISVTGRYVAFQSDATNLGAGVAGSWEQIYERDTCIGAPSGCIPTTIPISVTYDGSAPTQNSYTSSISADGRYVAFDSKASNILASSATICTVYVGDACTYLRDTCIGAPAGCQPNTSMISSTVKDVLVGGGNPSISPDGRFVGFNSTGASPGVNHVFLRDTCNGVPMGCTPQTTSISQSTKGLVGNENSLPQAVSTGGHYVVFQSFSNNLIPNDTNTWSDIFVRDTCIGAPSGCTPSTTIESLGINGAYGNEGLDGTVVPSISNDGRYVAFATDSTNMAPGMTTYACGFSGNVLVRDTCNGAATTCTPATSWVSIANDSSLPNCGSFNQSMSADGRFVAFTSWATNLVPGDTFTVASGQDIFVRDTCAGAPAGCTPSTVRVSVANNPPNITESNGIADYPQISGDGHYVVFMSEAFNLTTPISNGNMMVYLAKTGY
jgi:hypothetical protein